MSSFLQNNNEATFAVPLAEPLLLEQNDAEKKKQSSSPTTVDGSYWYKAKFILMGIFTGFFIQVISLGAYAFLLVRYQTADSDDDKENERDDFDLSTIVGFMKHFLTFQSFQQLGQETGSISRLQDGLNGTADAALYTIVSILTQIDLVAYILIWIAFTCTMTKGGFARVRSSFANDTTESLKRRFMFVLGVYFLVGIVLGAFLAWSSIDVYLGFPIPFRPIAVTVIIDLVLCYAMVWCYDLGRNRERQVNQNQKQLQKRRNINNNEKSYIKSVSDEDEEEEEIEEEEEDEIVLLNSYSDTEDSDSEYFIEDNDGEEPPGLKLGA